MFRGRGELTSRQVIESTAASADKNQHNSTLLLGQRAAEVFRWKVELERALEMMILEIDMLEEQRRRARFSKVALGKCKHSTEVADSKKFLN